MVGPDVVLLFGRFTGGLHVYNLNRNESGGLCGLVDLPSATDIRGYVVVEVCSLPVTTWEPTSDAYKRLTTGTEG